MIINPSTLAFSSSMTNVFLKYSICNWMLRYDCGGAGQYFRNLLTAQIRSLMTVGITNLKTMIIMVTTMIIIMDWTIKPKFYMNLLVKSAEVISWTSTSKRVTICNWYYQDYHNKHLFQTRISQDPTYVWFDPMCCIAVPCTDSHRITSLIEV